MVRLIQLNPGLQILKRQHLWKDLLRLLSKTGEPKWSCCKCNSSIRSVHFNEFSDLGPGLALTFRLMQVGWKFFILAFLLSSVGWVLRKGAPGNDNQKVCTLLYCSAPKTFLY